MSALDFLLSYVSALSAFVVGGSTFLDEVQVTALAARFLRFPWCGCFVISHPILGSLFGAFRLEHFGLPEVVETLTLLIAFESFTILLSCLRLSSRLYTPIRSLSVALASASIHLSKQNQTLAALGVCVHLSCSALSSPRRNFSQSWLTMLPYSVMSSREFLTSFRR